MVTRCCCVHKRKTKKNQWRKALSTHTLSTAQNNKLMLFGPFLWQNSCRIITSIAKCSPFVLKKNIPYAKLLLWCLLAEYRLLFQSNFSRSPIRKILRKSTVSSLDTLIWNWKSVSCKWSCADINEHDFIEGEFLRRSFRANPKFCLFFLRILMREYFCVKLYSALEISDWRVEWSVWNKLHYT